MGCRSHRARPDEAEAPVNGDMRFVAKGRDGDHWQRCPVGPIANLAADLQCSAGVDVLLRRLVGLVRPDFFSRFTSLDGLLLGICIPLLGRGNQRGINDLPGHRDVALLLQLLVKGFHHPLECARLGEFVVDHTERVLVRRRGAEVKLQKPHPRQPVPDHKFHPGIGKIVLRLEDQGLEHRYRVERRAAAFGTIAIAKTFDKPATEILKVDGRFQNFQRITDLADPLKMLRQTEKRSLLHQLAPKSVTK